MDTFVYIWQLLNPRDEFKNREQTCRRLWESFTLDKRLPQELDLFSDKLPQEYKEDKPSI